MHRTPYLLLTILGLALGLTVFAQPPGAEPPPSAGGRPPGIQYDTRREVTLQGTLTAVKVATRGPGPFVTLTFLSDGKTYEVMAGPEEKLKQQHVVFAIDDVVTIVGVPQEGPRGTLFLARQITRWDMVLTLLNQDGSPIGRPPQ